MNIEMSKADIESIARQVKEQLTKDVTRDSFREKVDEIVDRKTTAYLEMAITEEKLGDVFYKEIERFFDNNKAKISRDIAEILDLKIRDEAVREFILNRITESLDDFVVRD